MDKSQDINVRCAQKVVVNANNVELINISHNTILKRFNTVDEINKFISELESAKKRYI
jgi:hypothetical protein